MGAKRTGEDIMSCTDKPGLEIDNDGLFPDIILLKSLIFLY